MKKVLLTILAVLVLEAAGVLIVTWSGAYNISTTNHDNGAVNWVLDTGMARSVKRHAKSIHAPPLTDPLMVQEGFKHYDEMCVSCHGGPGTSRGEIAFGLWPGAPSLTRTVPDWTPAELFWITKYGIKFSAMPAWGPTHDDQKLWEMVAFLEKLPQLSPEEYEQMKTGAKTPEPRHDGESGPH